MQVSQIKAGAIISYIAIGINLIIGLVYTPWMINTIGKDNYGLYILATSVITLFMFDFGLGNAVTRFVSRFLAEGKQDKVNDFMGMVSRLYLGIDVFLFGVLLSVYFFIPNIYHELTAEEIDKFKVIYAIAACFSVLSFPFIPLDGIITAHERFIQLKLCELFNKLVLVTTMSICLFMGYGLYALVTVNAIAGLLTILLKLFIIRRYTNVAPNFKFRNRQSFKEIVGYSWWVTISALMQRMVFNVAPTILGMVAGSVEIALFGIASTFEGYVFTFASAINGLFLPRVTKMTLNQDKEALLSLMIRVGRIQIIIIGLIIIGFICLGSDFISLWLGSGYDTVYPSAVLLIIPSFFYLPQLIGSNAVLAMNKVKKQAYVFIIMGLFNLVAGYLLASIWGAFGFALSVFFAYMIRTVGMDVIFYKDLNINVLVFFKESFIKLAPSLGISCLGAFIVSYFMQSSSWLSWGVNVLCVILVYAGIMFLFGMKKDEKETFAAPLLFLMNRIRRNSNI